MSICENCMKPCKHGNIKQCGDWEPIKTNGDRVRAMSNEELAESMLLCPMRLDYECHEEDCKTCLLDWLNSPAESEG